MEIYLVGGAVRDQLLGRPCKERDWVVIGATPAEMLALGYRQVGKDFPVFLHPHTNEEYALARTERKTAPGYKGFTFDTNPHVTLEEDLRRRDLTINAIAQAADGKLIDPYGGQRDIAARCLRHVSSAFVEDPVRLLRVARFAAQLADYNFTVAAETQTLLQAMVKNNEVAALVPERIWQELQRALASDHPAYFFRELHNCRALKVIFPEFAALYEIIEQNHSLAEKALLALQAAVKQGANIQVRFAVLWHELDKITIADQSEVALLKNLCQRYRAPKEFQALAHLTLLYHKQYLQANQLTAQELLNVLEKTDAFRRPQRFAEFLSACQAIYNTMQNSNTRLEQAFNAAKVITGGALLTEHLEGEQLAIALKQARLVAIANNIN